MEQGNFEYSYSYDHLNRLISKTATLSEGKSARIEYTYIYGTALVGTKKLYLNNVLSETLSYTYDKSGNIATVIKDGTLLESYQYDELGQLVKTTKGSDIYEYTYDTRGNILTAKLNGVVTDTYAYGDANWKDKLTTFNGQTITYDNIGNPINYRDGMQFNWEKGRSLSQVIVNDGAGCFTYVTNSDGLRVNKDIAWFDGSDHPANYTFEYNGSQLISQTGNSNVIRFLYDESGCPTGFILNGAYYYYITNLQGDITAITDANGNIVAKYTYDEWGKPLSITDGNGNDVSANENHIANINPLRYRGYYYDSETGFYYLLTRYYDPVTRRFINADSMVAGTGESVVGYNLFAYCFNDPINLSDENGNWPKWAKKLAVAVAVVAVVAVVATVTVATAGTGTAAACVAIGAAKGAAIGFATGAVTGAASGAISHRVSTGSWDGAGEAALNGMADGALSGAITGAITGGMNSNACFVAGTAVLSSAGFVAIETIRAGDKVWAENPETGEKELKEVVQTFINETNELVHVFVNGEEIVTTPEHPFYSPTKGWTASCKLRAGDILVMQNGKFITVEKVQHEILETPITVYNFEVADFHTYYVGKNAVLVHNTCGRNSSSRGVGGKGWVGDKTWRENVSTVGNGGTITSLNGGIPTKAQAMQLINQSGGTPLRIEGAHQFPNPHNYTHINYVTSSGVKGTIKIFE